MANPVTDEERLAIVMQLKYDQLQKQITRGQKALDRGTSAMEKRAKQAADNMDKTMGKAAGSISDKLSGMFAPFLAGGAVAAVATSIKQIASTVAEVSREADKARVSTKVWQQWTYVAKATGASVDGVTDALKELNIRGDEFARTGKGSAQEAFERLGYTAADVAERLKDPSRFLDEIIGKVQKLDHAAQTRIVDEIWGGTGAEEMSKMLGLSVEQIQQLRSEAALFTDEQLAAAKKIDAEWETMWRNVMVYSKKAAIESVGYARQIANAINSLTGNNYLTAKRDYALSDEGRLNTYLERRADILERINDLRSKPDFDDAIDGLALFRLEDDLEAVDNQIASLTPHSKEFAAALRELSNITLGTSGAFNSTAAAAANFKQALTDLKNMVPELKAELDELAKLDQIDAAFQRAVQNAKSPAEIEEAARIRDRARTVATYGDQKDFFSLVRRVESGGNYNATLDNGRWTGGPQNLIGMTLDQVLALQSKMLANPENRAKYGNGLGSSALGAYQITRRTLKGSMKALGLAGDTMFDQTTQDAIASYLARSRGNDVEELRNEWEGLRRVDPDTIRSLYSKTDLAPVKVQPSESQQKAIDEIKRQDEARKSLNQTVQEGLDQARFEQSLTGMTASQKRVELELYRYQQDAKRNGLTLTDEEIRKAREQITMTEQLRLAQAQAANEAQGLRTAQEYFAQSFTSSLSGLLTGTTSLTDAVRNLASSLMDAVLQASLLGQGPLAGLFGTAGGGGLFGAIFGWAEGGYTGPGGKHQPAGVVHRGEYVMSAAATRRLGVKNLERLHQTAKRGYAEGGYVGPTPTLRNPELKAANSNAPVQQISISAPITVNGSAGTPEQNTDLANKMARTMEQSMRGMVADELRRQTRPGNYMNSRSR